jgi:hypothetical protein
MDDDFVRINNILKKSNINNTILFKRQRDVFWNSYLMQNLNIWYYMPFWQKLGEGKYWKANNVPPSGL